MKIRPAWLAIAALLACLPGCDTASSDFASFTESFNPPTPSQAAQWALDMRDAENQRRGTLLLAGSDFGSESGYVRMYRLYIEENQDPLVRVAAIEALGRHGDADDAELIARQLKDKSVQVRVAAAKALQRIHNPKVTTALCSRLIDEGEESSVRIELAIALGQYPSDDAFQALAASLDARELGVNLAALDSLHLMTDQDFGLDRPLWLSWYASTRTPFSRRMQYLYPTYWREKGFWDHLIFWAPLRLEQPGVPVGMQEPEANIPRDPFGNVGDDKAPEAKGPTP